MPVAALTFIEFELPQITDVASGQRHVVLDTEEQTVEYGGSFTQRAAEQPAITTIQGDPLRPGDVAIRFLRPAVRTARALWLNYLQAIRRANVIRVSHSAQLLTWLASSRYCSSCSTSPCVLVRSPRGIRSVALRHTAYVIAFVHAALWAVLLHPFHGADESEHFAYAQHLATTNERADAGFTRRSPYSILATPLDGGLHHNSTVLNTTARPRWLNCLRGQIQDR